jgi:hypothetical protein
MTISIRPLTADLLNAVHKLNQRLGCNGVGYHFPEHETPDWLPRRDGLALYHEYFVAEDAGDLRGGYIFKHQEFAIGDQVTPVGFFRLPISEGAYDARYTTLATQFLLHALKKNQSLFSLGIGGYDEPLAKLERGAGWTQWTLPFHFLVLRAHKFLANIEHLRRKSARRWIIDASRWTGLGSLAIHAWQAMRRARSSPTVNVKVEQVSDFGAWADDLWERSFASHSFVAVRDAKCLAALYPTHDPQFTRLRISDRDATLGWAVILANQLRNHKHFGNMKLGSVVDCLAVPGNERLVVEAATKQLRDANCDLVVSNQSHVRWCTAFDAAGYMRGPSNFIFSASKKLVQRIDEVDPKHERLHLTRGDGDGPIHL